MSIHIWAMKPAEEQEVSALVVRVFTAYVAPLYSPEGVQEFLRYADPQAIALRSTSTHFVLVAEYANICIAMIEVRDYDHISMLFVEGEHQRKGISRSLLREALSICKESRPDLSSVTVHASPNAIGAYQQLGFFPTAAEQSVNGIRFTPMILSLHQER